MKLEIFPQKTAMNIEQPLKTIPLMGSLSLIPDRKCSFLASGNRCDREPVSEKLFCLDHLCEKPTLQNSCIQIMDMAKIMLLFRKQENYLGAMLQSSVGNRYQVVPAFSQTKEFISAIKEFDNRLTNGTLAISNPCYDRDECVLNTFGLCEFYHEKRGRWLQSPADLTRPCGIEQLCGVCPGLRLGVCGYMHCSEIVLFSNTHIGPIHHAPILQFNDIANYSHHELVSILTIKPEVLSLDDESEFTSFVDRITAFRDPTCETPFCTECSIDAAGNAGASWVFEAMMESDTDEMINGLEKDVNFIAEIIDELIAEKVDMRLFACASFTYDSPSKILLPRYIYSANAELRNKGVNFAAFSKVYGDNSYQEFADRVKEINLALKCHLIDSCIIAGATYVLEMGIVEAARQIQVITKVIEKLSHVDISIQLTMFMVFGCQGIIYDAINHVKNTREKQQFLHSHGSVLNTLPASASLMSMSISYSSMSSMEDTVDYAINYPPLTKSNNEPIAAKKAIAN